MNPREEEEYEKSIDGGSDSGSEVGSVNSDNDSVYSAGDDMDGGGEDSGIEDYDNMDEDGENNEGPRVDMGDAGYERNSDDEDEDDDDGEDEDYLQKLDDQFRKKVIENHHPELKTLNYEEIDALARVVRDNNFIIIDPLHRTIPVLTRYEKARILGERAKQINMGAKPFVEVDESMIDGYLIALKELDQKAIPFIIQRPLPNGGSEYWRVSDLEVLA